MTDLDPQQLVDEAQQRVDQADAEHRAAVAAEVQAARRRAAAERALFIALQRRYAQQLVGADVNVNTVPIPCRDCVRALPADSPGHDLVAESGRLLYLVHSR